MGSGHAIPLINTSPTMEKPPNGEPPFVPVTPIGHFRKNCDSIKKIPNNKDIINNRRRNNSSNGILPLMNQQPTITLLANDVNNGLNGTPPSNKTQSLPTNTSISDMDAVVLNALRIPPEELAGQITLLDFPAFSEIQPDELTSCAWTKKNKYTVAPNIVAFTRRFNHTSFWTIQEILSGPTPKRRAEIMSHFIKVN